MTRQWQLDTMRGAGYAWGMSTDHPSYTLDELAKETGLSPRTIRYYVQRGVLPAPVFRGPHTAYDARYVDWLRYVAARQLAGWTLDQIALALADLDPETGRSRGFRTLTAADLRAVPLPHSLVQSAPSPRTPAAEHHAGGEAGASMAVLPSAVPPAADPATTNVNSPPDHSLPASVQAPAALWIRMPIADGIEMWLRHETDAQQRLLQDVVLDAAQKAAAAARKETR